MFKPLRALLVSLALVTTAAQADAPARAQAIAMPLLADHPLGIFQTAIAQFEQGQKEEAVYLFYLAQLRWRRYMDANPDLPPDQDRALFASLHDVFGRPVNEWAFGDIDWLVATLRNLDAFDAATPDPVTPASDFPQVHAHSRSGFAAFIDMIEADADDIRAGRLRNGLENR